MSRGPESIGQRPTRPEDRLAFDDLLERGVELGSVLQDNTIGKYCVIVSFGFMSYGDIFYAFYQTCNEKGQPIPDANTFGTPVVRLVKYLRGHEWETVTVANS